MGKGGKGEVQNAFARNAKGGSMFSRTSGTLDVNGLQSALNSYLMTNSNDNCEGTPFNACCIAFKTDQAQIASRGGSVPAAWDGMGGDQTGGGVMPGFGMLDGRGVSPEHAAALMRIYDPSGTGEIGWHQYVEICKLLSHHNIRDEFKTLATKMQLEKFTHTINRGQGISRHSQNPLQAKFAAEPPMLALANPSKNTVCCAAASEFPIFGMLTPFPFVCFWPHSIIFFGSPCAYCAKPCWLPTANAATTVHLTKGAVVSVTEPYPGWSPCFGPPCCSILSCCLVCCGASPACFDAYENAERVVDVVPLEFVDSVDLLPPLLPGGLGRVLVTAYGGIPFLAKDGATNGPQFVEAVHQAKQNAPRLDPNERAALHQFLATSWVRARAGNGCDIGQLQRLISRSFPTRFG